MKTKFETPGQRQMWLDAIMNIKVEPLPSEYDSETWDDIPSDDATLSDEELEAISAEVSDEDLEEAVLTEDPTFTYDPDLKAIKMEENGLVAHGLYNTEYEDLFYKVWIEENGQIVYQNDYGKEKFNSDHISDDTIDGVLDNLVTYAMEVDSNLHEAFEIVEETLTENSLEKEGFERVLVKVGALMKYIMKSKGRSSTSGEARDFEKVLDKKFGKSLIGYAKLKRDGSEYTLVNPDESGMYNIEKNEAKNIFKSIPSLKEETLEEDFSNINMLQGLKGKSITLKLKDGSSIDVASDEAKIIAKRYEELKGDLQKKFADLLNKSQQSFLIAYKDAYKD